MSHVEILFGQLQKRETDTIVAKNCVSSFDYNVKKIKDKVNEINTDVTSSFLKEEGLKAHQKLKEQLRNYVLNYLSCKRQIQIHWPSDYSVYCIKQIFAIWV